MIDLNGQAARTGERKIHHAAQCFKSELQPGTVPVCGLLSRQQPYWSPRAKWWKRTISYCCSSVAAYYTYESAS